jgi:hypothetical protein
MLYQSALCLEPSAALLLQLLSPALQCQLLALDLARRHLHQQTLRQLQVAPHKLRHL